MRTLLIVAAVLLLSACTGSTRQSYSTLKPSEYELDHAKIAAVERQARMNWGKVVWISLPRKRINDNETLDN